MAAGDITSEDFDEIDGQTDSGSGVTKGQVIYWTSGNVATATATTDGPYGVALATAAASATNVRVMTKGTVYLTASGAVTKGTLVSTAAAGAVAATTVDMTTVSTLGAALKRIVGVALDTVADAAVLRVRLGGIGK